VYIKSVFFIKLAG